MKSSFKWKNTISKRRKNSWWNMIRRERRKSGIARSSETDLKVYTEVLTWTNNRNLEILGEMQRALPWLFIKKSTGMDPLSLLAPLAGEHLRVSIKTMVHFKAKISNKIDRVSEWWRGWVAWITRLRPLMALQEVLTLVIPSTQTDPAYFQAWREPRQSWTQHLSTSKGRTR